MDKTCVRCGCIIKNAPYSQKYCRDCAHKVELEQKKASRVKRKTKLEMSVCKICGRAMRKYYPNQEAHVMCESRTLAKERRAQRQEKRQEQAYQFNLPQKKHQEPPKYTVAQCDNKARELGMTYGKYVLLLSQGKVEPPDER